MELILNGYKTYLISLVVVIFVQLLSIAICVDSRPRCFDRRDLSMRGVSSCPVDSFSFRENGRLRSSFVSLLSSELALSMKELELSFLLKKSGGEAAMRKNSTSSLIDTLRNPQKIALEEKIKRAQDRIKLAKKYIYEQELSAKLEHLKMRKAEPDKSGS